MIQVTLKSDEATDPGTPMDIAPVSSGERQPFLRDRTFGETNDLILEKVKSGEWVKGRYSVYQNGIFVGGVEA